jgi:hypothetical protein
MFKLIRQIAGDDGAVKALFDHVRNLGIASAVFGAAVWQFQHPGYVSAYYFSMAIVVLLFTFAAFLFFVNQLHGMMKLRASGYPGWLFQVTLHTYSLVTVTLIASLVWKAA